MLRIILFVLCLILLAFFGPIGWILGTILIIVSLIILIAKGVIGTGKFINKTLTTKECPYCYSEIDNRASVCPQCNRDFTA